MDKEFHPTLNQVGAYLYMLRLKLNHVSKSGPWWGASSQSLLRCIRRIYKTTALWSTVAATVISRQMIFNIFHNSVSFHTDIVIDTL